MSVRFRLVNMFDTSVRHLLIIECQKWQHAVTARRGSASRRRRRRARPAIGCSSCGYSAGSYSRSASCTRQKSPLRLSDGRAHGRALALIHRVPEQTNARLAGREAFQNLGRAIGRAIVDDHQLAIHVLRQRRGQHQRQAPLHNRPLVVDRNQNGELHPSLCSLPNRDGTPAYGRLTGYPLNGQKSAGPVLS